MGHGNTRWRRLESRAKALLALFSPSNAGERGRHARSALAVVAHHALVGGWAASLMKHRGGLVVELRKPLEGAVEIPSLNATRDNALRQTVSLP